MIPEESQDLSVRLPDTTASEVLVLENETQKPRI